MPSAAQLKALTTNKIRKYGQPLTVSRRTTQGAADSTRTVYFLPQPLSAQQAGELLLEAGVNAGEGNPYDFVCTGNSDVAENDTITFNGFAWRVANINPQNMSGVEITMHCYATRETKQ